MASMRATRSRVRLSSVSASSSTSSSCAGMPTIFAHRRVGEVIVQPSRNLLRLRDAGDGSVGQLVEPAADGNGIFSCKRSGAAHVGHIERHAAPVDMLERPELLPLFERLRPGPAIDLAHRRDILARIGEKLLPLCRILAWVRAFDAEQPDQLLAIFLLAGAPEIARGALEIGWQVGDTGLHHRIDDTFRREKGKSE